MKPLSALSHFPYDPVPGEVTQQLTITVARGEVASHSFSIAAQSATGDLEVSVSPLQDSTGNRFPGCVDLHVVHRWRQAGIGLFQSHPVEVDELLLKDDRVSLRDGYRRRCASPFHAHWSGNRYRPPDLRLDGAVRTSITSGSTKQIWISVRGLDDARPGTYEGSVVACDTASRSNRMETAFRIEVLDLTLAEPVQNTMLWYRGTLNCHDDQHYVAPRVLQAQLRDIRQHGFRSLSLFETNPRLLQDAVDMAQAAGFCGDVVLDGFSDRLWSAVDFGRLKPIAYVSDEIDSHGPERVELHIAAIGEAKNAGARTMASIVNRRTAEQFNQNAALGGRPDVVSIYAPFNRDSMNFLDGHEGDVYYYWQAHMEKPLVHRLLAGFMLWKSGADGISPYCYQHLPAFPYSPFDDFDPWEPLTHQDHLGRQFKDHMATYPARRGPIPTLQWRGMADGLMDLRYLTTLDRAMTDAGLSLNPAARKLAGESRARLSSMLEELPWANIDILSDTSSRPYPEIGCAQIRRIRDQIVRDLIDLRRLE